MDEHLDVNLRETGDPSGFSGRHFLGHPQPKHFELAARQDTSCPLPQVFSLFQLLELPGRRGLPAREFRRDHFVERDGMRFAGTHLIIDLWQAASLDDIDVVKTALKDAAKAAGATLLKIDLHCFTPNGGITGVAVLAESHISIHTWPERAYAAVDVFMCGDAEPHKASACPVNSWTPH